MTDQEVVKQKWPDAKLMSAFAVQPDKSRKWMWCAESSMAFLSRKDKRTRVVNIGAWRFSEAEAWADAAKRIREPGA